MDAASIHWPMENQGWANGNMGKGFSGSSESEDQQWSFNLIELFKVFLELYHTESSKRLTLKK